MTPARIRVIIEAVRPHASVNTPPQAVFLVRFRVPGLAPRTRLIAAALGVSDSLVYQRATWDGAAWRVRPPRPVGRPRKDG